MTTDWTDQGRLVVTGGSDLPLSWCGALMFNCDGKFWPQLAAYLSALIVALSVLYSIGQLLTADNRELSLNLGLFFGWIARGQS